MSLPKFSRQILSFVKSSIRNQITRSYAAKQECMKVTVCGAAGNIGQPVSLILKQCCYIDNLSIYDAVGVTGFGMELDHINTRTKVCAYSGIETVKAALEDSSIVVIVAAAPGTSHLSFSAMFEPNANVVHQIAQNIAVYCPKALIAVATNPVNSMLPLVSQVMKLNGVYNPQTIFGVTAVDVVRANTLVARLQGLKPESVVVPVIGGHSDRTIIPVLSQAKPCADFTNNELEDLTKDIQLSSIKVIKEKRSSGDNLACAFATAKFVISLIKALRGYSNVIECAFVRSTSYKEAKFLATPLLLGPRGVEENYGLPKLSFFEKCQLESAVPIIMNDVRKGESFAGGTYPPPCDPCKDADCPPNWCQVEEFY